SRWRTCAEPSPPVRTKLRVRVGSARPTQLFKRDAPHGVEPLRELANSALATSSSARPNGGGEASGGPWSQSKVEQRVDRFDLHQDGCVRGITNEVDS